MTSFGILVCLVACLAGQALAAPQRRIINGTEPSLFEFKSIVSIWMHNMHYCGGTLVDDDTVLTAAHCFYLVQDPSRYNMHVRINAHNFHDPHEKERKVKVVKVIPHPQWSMRNLTYDFLILKLAEKVPQSSTVHYAPLPFFQGIEPTTPGTKCVVVGWGTLNPMGWPGTHILQKGSMKIISNQECKDKGKIRRQFQNIGKSHICTKSAHETTSACKGDSGGPLFCYPLANFYQKVQVGVVSFGDIPCAQKDMPVAFARISHVVNWIRSHY